MRCGHVQRMLYPRALKTTLIGTALPYGFTVTLLGAFQVILAQQPKPSVGHVFLFAAGAASAYGMLRLLLEPFDAAGSKPSKSERPVREGIVHVAAIGLGIGAAALVGMLDTGAVWAIGGFVAMLAYLLTNGGDAALQARSES